MSSQDEAVTRAELPRLQALASERSAAGVVGLALEVLGEDVAIAFSGAEDVLLIEYARQSGRRPRVFALETGRLHPETLRFFATVEEHYGLRIEYVVPDHHAVTRLVRAKGLFSFFQDGHGECCQIRKVDPLRAYLSTLRGWVTGQRRDQSPSTRKDVARVDLDPAHVGRDGAPLLKFNPLAEASSAEVWAAIRAFEVPYNPLHSRGFVSIGCEPCTRAILPGQHEREGRWWWEDETKKECGLHLGGARTDHAPKAG